MPIKDPSDTDITEIILPDGNTASEVIAPDGTTVFSAIPDSVVDNFEDATASPVGPYSSTDSITDYYTITSGDYARTTNNSIKDSKSVERTTTSGDSVSDFIVSLPGDGLLNYPSDGGSVSVIIKSDLTNSQTLLAAAPSQNAKGYILIADSTNNWLLQRLDSAGSNTGLDSSSNSSSGNETYFELVIKPPATGGSTVEAAVWELDSNHSRTTQVTTLSASDSNYAGERGIGVGLSSGSGLETFADEIRVGRSLN